MAREEQLELNRGGSCARKRKHVFRLLFAHGDGHPGNKRAAGRSNEAITAIPPPVLLLSISCQVTGAPVGKPGLVADAAGLPALPGRRVRAQICAATGSARSRIESGKRPGVGAYSDLHVITRPGNRPPISRCAIGADPGRPSRQRRRCINNGRAVARRVDREACADHQRGEPAHGMAADAPIGVAES